MRLARGDRLGPYEIADMLGEGGMGEVYRARDTRLDRDVAVKTLRLDRDDAEWLHRFEREAKTIAALDHPNLLTMFDIGCEEGPEYDTQYLVTELLRGETLRARLDRVTRLAWRDVATIGEGIARGLGAAHARGVVHRDIKPENVFLTDDGRVKILDFGLAYVTLAEMASQLQTLPGTMLGTVPYMAPEQARGEPVDARTDLFSLGVVLYECLAGVSPFKRANMPATLIAIFGEEPRPLDGPLGPLVLRLLAKRREDRAAGGAAQVADELAQQAAANPSSQRSSAPVLAMPSAPASIAVLPFADLSPTADQAYFCDGIAEEILHALTRLGGVRVAARGSSFQYRGGAHDTRAVGRALDVDHVLEGSVRRAGQRVRITVQLVDVASGRQIWAERYDRVTDDVFAIQDEIAARTASTLSIAMTEDARRAWRQRGTQDLAAYEAYLQGRALASAHTRTGTREAIAAYTRALDLDPTFAAAWCALAEAHTLAFEWYGRSSADAARAGAASERALACDPQSAETLTARGQALVVGDRLDEAAAEFARALEVAPGFYGALYAFARVRVAQGKFAEAIELFERGARVRTDDYQCLALEVAAHRAVGELDKAVDCARRTVARVERRLAIAPNDERALCLGALAQIEIGQNERAMEWSQRARKLAADDPSVLYNIACALVRAGYPDPALDTLEQAVGMGFGQRTWFEHDSDLDALRATPRFQALVERLPR